MSFIDDCGLDLSLWCLIEIRFNFRVGGVDVIYTCRESRSVGLDKVLAKYVSEETRSDVVMFLRSATTQS